MQIPTCMPRLYAEAIIFNALKAVKKLGLQPYQEVAAGAVSRLRCATAASDFWKSSSVNR